MKKNFLLGKGERLTEDISVKSGGGEKAHPYSFDEAKNRLGPMLSEATSAIDALPPDACPQDQAVLSITLNPEYLAKTYFPSALFEEVGFEIVGSKPKKIKPEKRSRNRETKETVSTELFAKGTRNAIRKWNQNLARWTGYKNESGLITIEEILAPEPQNKIKGTINDHGNSPIEIVLHANEIETNDYVLQELEKYLAHREISTKFGHRFFAKGLCFLEMDAPAERLDEIAQFSLVRALRQMPVLRLFEPPVRSTTIPSTAPSLPDHNSISPETRIAIFDGGIPVNHPFTRWVHRYEFPNMRPATPEILSHGVAVTSAALFGHIHPRKPLQIPYCHIDHYRVLDDNPNTIPCELYDVLERIESVLLEQEYDFVNLSLGPNLPIEDDEVHAWTAVLDDYFSRNKTLATIAVGNDGESDPTLGFNRVQVPADCVNALAIGACDTPDSEWQRAPYSSVGPGRSPGLIKPDLVDFGGVTDRPFVVFGPELTPTLSTTGGTSFASPNVIRLASGLRAHFGSSINHLAIRTLLIHTSENQKQDISEVGWGRVARNLEDITLCDDDSIRVVYQGEISPAKYVRAPIPLPPGIISGNVLITATLCYKSETDPHHPGNYTRAGLQVTFRPHDEKFSNGESQRHPNSKNFFKSNTAGLTEEELRRDSWKWENCLHSSKKTLGSSLKNPCFDIHYNSRLEGRGFNPDENLSYALVVTVKAKKINDLYDQVVRQYANRLEPIRPLLEIPVQTLL